MKRELSFFECQILKLGTSEVLGKVHCIAYNLFHASHVMMEYLNEDESKFGNLVEIGQIKKLTDVTDIINPYFLLEDDEEDIGNYDPELPYSLVENIPDGDPRVMKFKCSCREELRVSSGDWLYVDCRNCENRIYRREVEEVGNIHLYVKKTK